MNLRVVTEHDLGYSTRISGGKSLFHSHESPCWLGLPLPVVPGPVLRKKRIESEWVRTESRT